MEMIIEFFKANFLALILSTAGVAILIVAIIAIKSLKNAKKREAEEYERIINNAPAVDVDDEEESENAAPKSDKPADYAWLRGETASAKPAAEKTADAATDDKEKGKKIIGKWLVKEKGEGEFIAFLYANNGEMLLSSEIYTSADGAKKGVATIRKNASGDGSFQVYCDKNSRYYFKLKTSNNRFLCVGETYPSKTSCLGAIESVKRFVDSPIAENVERDITSIKYEPSEGAIISRKSGYSGKWEISKVDDMFIATLYASNGEALLSSESYLSYASARSAVNTIKANGIEGNFIIERDKNDRYFFKLRNAQKSTLCVGESYSQESACRSAIDSVRRFLTTAKLVEKGNDELL
ncbi:MAG: YegP family protein [Clostridia bacterium]|nr:YegP family protein [Clostridia bacterium]